MRYIFGFFITLGIVLCTGVTYAQQQQNSDITLHTTIQNIISKKKLPAEQKIRILGIIEQKIIKEYGNTKKDFATLQQQFFTDVAAKKEIGKKQKILFFLYRYIEQTIPTELNTLLATYNIAWLSQKNVVLSTGTDVVYYQKISDIKTHCAVTQIFGHVCNEKNTLDIRVVKGGNNSFVLLVSETEGLDAITREIQKTYDATHQKDFVYNEKSTKGGYITIPSSNRNLSLQGRYVYIDKETTTLVVAMPIIFSGETYNTFIDPRFPERYAYPQVRIIYIPKETTKIENISKLLSGTSPRTISPRYFGNQIGRNGLDFEEIPSALYTGTMQIGDKTVTYVASYEETEGSPEVLRAYLPLNTDLFTACILEFSYINANTIEKNIANEGTQKPILTPKFEAAIRDRTAQRERQVEFTLE